MKFIGPQWQAQANMGGGSSSSTSIDYEIMTADEYYSSTIDPNKIYQIFYECGDYLLIKNNTCIGAGLCSSYYAKTKSDLNTYLSNNNITKALFYNVTDNTNANDITITNNMEQIDIDIYQKYNNSSSLEFKNNYYLKKVNIYNYKHCRIDITCEKYEYMNGIAEVNFKIPVTLDDLKDSLYIYGYVRIFTGKYYNGGPTIQKATFPEGTKDINLESSVSTSYIGTRAIDVHIPSSVIHISNADFFKSSKYIVNDGTFKYLDNHIIENSDATITNIPNCITFNSTNHSNSTIIFSKCKGICDNFNNTSSNTIVDITLPTDLEYIGKYAFYQNVFNNRLVLPTSTKIIKQCAFLKAYTNSQNVLQISIPDSCYIEEQDTGRDPYYAADIYLTSSGNSDVIMQHSYNSIYPLSIWSKGVTLTIKSSNIIDLCLFSKYYIDSNYGSYYGSIYNPSPTNTTNRHWNVESGYSLTTCDGIAQNSVIHSTNYETSYTITSNIKFISSNAFIDLGGSSTNYPDNYNTTINIPSDNNIYYIGYNAFNNNKAIIKDSNNGDTLYLNNIQIINEYAFCHKYHYDTSVNLYNRCGIDSSIKTIHIGNKIRKMYPNALYGLTNLTIEIDKPKDSIEGAPWGAYCCTIKWQGEF